MVGEIIGLLTYELGSSRDRVFRALSEANNSRPMNSMHLDSWFSISVYAIFFCFHAYLQFGGGCYDNSLGLS